MLIDCGIAMGWGSGTSNFPYLVSPLTAIQNKVVSVGGVIQSVTDNYALNQAQTIASQASVSLVFVNSDSGEGYISVDGNLGDRRNLTLWKDGEGLISAVASKCNNTIVIIHSVGPVLVDKFYDHENVTAILWAGLPGEQSGNAITDIIYGQVNPAAKLPFTIGASREDYGTGILYEPNNGNDAPQQGFTEGIFIDYRAFDKSDKKPIYEFGFGLSYTTFIYSNIQVTKYNVGPLVPTTGFTEPAPELGNHSADPKDYQFPQEFTRLPNYIYPYLSSTDPKSAYNNTDYGLPVGDWLLPNAQKGTQQAKVPAGGAPGGHPQLYDVMYTVTAEITNTGKRGGEEVVQLYISLGGPNDAKVVLRNFERLSIDVGQTTTFRADITRRDISNWDSAGQAWVIRDSDKTLYVGSSSRSLQLSARLPR